MSADIRHDLIFAHASDARVATSVILAGMVSIFIGSAFMVLQPRLALNATFARNPNADTLAAPVRVIDAGPRKRAPCDLQVWPNIDQRCLVRSRTATRLDSNKRTSAASTAEDNALLTPLTATGSKMHRQWPTKDDASESALQPKMRQRERIASSTVTADDGNDMENEIDVLPPPRPVERPHRHVRGRYGFPIHLRFGPFRF
jgi:hypothetical protein